MNRRFDNLRLDHQLCFALYAATHAITRTYRGSLGEVGLTYPQYLVMLVLWEADGLAVGTIAATLDLDAATLTPLLKRLEAAGFVTRRRSNADERVVEVRLTPRGRALQAQVAQIQKRVACQTGLGDAEFRALRATLHRLVESLAGPAPEPAPPARTADARRAAPIRRSDRRAPAPPARS